MRIRSGLSVLGLCLAVLTPAALGAGPTPRPTVTPRPTPTARPTPTPRPGVVTPTPKASPTPAPIDPGVLPPDWLPVQMVETSNWFNYKKNPPPGPRLYLPSGVERIRGVFVCYIFHSQDPRELADLWQFALLAIPPQCEYDIGFYDKRNPRGESGIKQGNMGNVLTYLQIAAKETNHPELAVAPIVGWVGQNGGPIASDLFTRAPQRVIAWTDSWDWSKYPLSASVPLANAWELKEQERAGPIASLPGLAGKFTPPKCMAAVATTYGFGHGIFSKYHYFSAFMDRCIQLRLPAEPPPAGQPVPLKPLRLEDGWAGDFAPISSWNPIAPFREAKGFAQPVWFPDEYTACMWRAFHSNAKDLVLTSPRKAWDKSYSPEIGNGYGGHLSVGDSVTFSAKVTGPYVKVEYWDGNIKLGEATAEPWDVSDVKLEHKGVRAFHAVGVRADGTKSASLPALAIVE